jgi:hypothetical protein
MIELTDDEGENKENYQAIEALDRSMIPHAKESILAMVKKGVDSQIELMMWWRWLGMLLMITYDKEGTSSLEETFWLLMIGMNDFKPFNLGDTQILTDEFIALFNHSLDSDRYQ